MLENDESARGATAEYSAYNEEQWLCGRFAQGAEESKAVNILAIGRNAFLESIRQPVFVVLLLGGTIALALNVSLAAFTFEDDNKLLIDLGMSTLFLAGLLLAAFGSTSVLTREIENKTVLTVVSKPVSRAALVIGKYVGIAAALSLAYWSLAAIFLLSVRHRVQFSTRIDDSFDVPVLLFSTTLGGLALAVAALANYLYRRPFASVFAVGYAVAMTAALGMVWCVSRDWEFQDPRSEWNPQLMIALGLVFQAILVLAAVAIAVSTRLTQTMTLLVCVGTFFVGLVSEYFLGTLLTSPAGSAAPATTASWLSRGLLWPLYTFIPNLQYFWPADALTQGHAITLDYFATVTLYAVLMIGGLISFAVILFQGRDVS